MEEEILKENISKKITYYRKLNNLTQSELAEKINYSDKSVSKWERGDGIPDIFVLTKIADLFGITVNDLIYEETEDTVKKHEKLTKYQLKKIIFTYILSIGLVWLVAAVFFVMLKIIFPNLKMPYYPFIMAIPTTFIVTLVFSNIWRNLIVQFISTSGIIWGVTACLMSAITAENISLLLIIAVILQVLAIFWFVFRAIRYKYKYSSKD